jgi:hypothetical protein
MLCAKDLKFLRRETKLYLRHCLVAFRPSSLLLQSYFMSPLSLELSSSAGQRRGNDIQGRGGCSHAQLSEPNVHISAPFSLRSCTLSL